MFVVDPEVRFGIVSDIDDTVMVTALPRPLLAAWHTFVVNEHARATTPGMPVLYERLTSQHPGAPVIYLSTGAWNVAPTLTRFLSRNLYPAGALLLTDWGPTADAWFRSGREHKRNSLERLAREFPQIKWLLIGDDGQHDESIYGDFVRQHPDNVAAVCIRQLTPSEAVLAGSSLRERAPSNGSRVPWLYASDGAALADQLEQIGFLGGGRRSSPKCGPERFWWADPRWSWSPDRPDQARPRWRTRSARPSAARWCPGTRSRRAWWRPSRASSAPTSDPLTLRTYGTFFANLDLLLRAEVTTVAEAAFQHRLWTQGLGRWTAWPTSSHPLPAGRRTRRGNGCGAGGRAADPGRPCRPRPPGRAARFTPADPGVPTLDVDTTDGYQPDLAAVVAFCRG